MWLIFDQKGIASGGGGHWPRKGVWGCAALKTPFSHLSCRSQGSYFKQKSQFTRPPFEKIWKFYPQQPQFYLNLSSQAPKFWNFKLTIPQIWKFSAHKPPNLEIFRSQAPLFRGKCQFASPTLRKSGPHTPTWKKSWVPPPPRIAYFGNLGRTAHISLPKDKLREKKNICCVEMIHIHSGMIRRTVNTVIWKNI